MGKKNIKRRNQRTTEYTPSPEEQKAIREQMSRAKPAQQQEIITSVPARIIEKDRKTSHTIIDALANTALAISGGENPVEKMSVLKDLWAMQKEAEDRQAEREFNTAKVLVAMQLPQIPKTGLREFKDKNNQVQSSSYALLDDIEGVLDPICRTNGIVKEYSSKTDAKGWACQVLTVRHVSGHKEVYESPYMPLDTTGSKNNNQGAGSTAKYGRRYALIGAFNIFHVDDDTDGATVTGEPKEDKFAARVQEEAAKQQPKGPAPLSLPEAAAALESKLRNAPVEKRAETLMKHINIIEAMEKDETLKPKAAELRQLCEEKANEPH
jgi:ERF superfamily